MLENCKVVSENPIWKSKSSPACLDMFIFCYVNFHLSHFRPSNGYFCFIPKALSDVINGYKHFVFYH